MATPIENNTEGLVEILRAVNDLPNAEGGGGVLCVTADFGTMTASHSPAEILEAVNSGKGVYLCVYDTAALIVLPLVGYDAALQKATFCNTVSAVGEVGTQFGIIHAIVHADKSVTFDNDGSVMSMCVPVAENTDVGKVLSVSANGLAWVKPSEGGNSGGSFEIPLIDLNELGYLDGMDPNFSNTVEISQTEYDEIVTKLQFGCVKIRMTSYDVPETRSFLTIVCTSPGYELYRAQALLQHGVTVTFDVFINTKTNKPNAEFRMEG